jgi:uncharacterized protein YbcI
VADTQDGSQAQPVMVQAANEMVRIYKDQFGRGPQRAYAGFAGPDLLIATLEGSLTPAERNMVEMGELQRVRDIRSFFQHASEREFTEAIERTTGRRVRAFVSGIDVEHDIASEVFYLEAEDR